MKIRKKQHTTPAELLGGAVVARISFHTVVCIWMAYIEYQMNKKNELNSRAERTKQRKKTHTKQHTFAKIKLRKAFV